LERGKEVSISDGDLRAIVVRKEATSIAFGLNMGYIRGVY
jgi:hypothetical protein